MCRRPCPPERTPFLLFFHSDRMLPAHTGQVPLPPSVYRFKRSSCL